MGLCGHKGRSSGSVGAWVRWVRGVWGRHTEIKLGAHPNMLSFKRQPARANTRLQRGRRWLWCRSVPKHATTPVAPFRHIGQGTGAAIDPRPTKHAFSVRRVKPFMPRSLPAASQFGMRSQGPLAECDPNPDGSHIGHEVLTAHLARLGCRSLASSMCSNGHGGGWVSARMAGIWARTHDTEEGCEQSTVSQVCAYVSVKRSRDRRNR